MLAKHEKSKFTQRLNDIFKWSKEKIGSSSRDNIDSVFEAEYAALLHEIEGLANKHSCTVSFKNENFSKPVISSDEVSSLLKNHSSEVIDKYVRKHDKSKKYKNLTPEDFLTYLTEIIVTKCNNNECSCSRHKITLKKDGVKQETNKEVVREITPGKYEFDSQVFDEFKNEKDTIATTNGYEVSNGSSRNRNSSDPSRKIEPQPLNGSIRSKNASELNGNKRYSSELKNFNRGSVKQSSFENDNTDRMRFIGGSKQSSFENENPELRSSNRGSQKPPSFDSEKRNLTESSINGNRLSVSKNNGYEQKGCNNKLCTCKPFKATKEIATEQVKLSISENIQADADSKRLSKDKSALINDNASLIGSRKNARQSFQATPIENKPKFENEGIQTSDCTINPNCYCCKRYATIPEEPRNDNNGNSTKVIMKDQDTKMAPDTAVQTSRLCVPKNYEQLMQDPNMKIEFSNCPLDKKDCICDAYDAKLAVERGWVLPSSEMCMQTGRKSTKTKPVKSDTDVTSVSSMEPRTKDQNLQFKGEKSQKAPPAEPTENEVSTDDYQNAGKEAKKIKNKVEEAKQPKKQREKAKAEKNKKKEKPKETNKDKKENMHEITEDKFIKCPTCASDSSLNTLLEHHKNGGPKKQVKYDYASDTTDTSSVTKKPKTGKKVEQKAKNDKTPTKKSKKQKQECEDEEEISGCFGKKKKRPREKCEADCEAECNRAIQTKPALTANKKDQANLVTVSTESESNKKPEKADKKVARRASNTSLSSDASSQKTKTSIKSGSTIKCGKCGKEKKRCCQGCRNTIVVQPGSSRNLQDSNSLKLLIKMQAKDTNRRFDDLMTELNCQKTEIQRLNSMYKTMLHDQRTSGNNIVSRANQDRNDNRRSSNITGNNNDRNATCCPCDEDRKRYGPEGTTVAINRCDVCHFDIARGQFPNFIRETYSRETYSDCRCGDCESEKCRKDMINHSRQHLHRKPFSYSNSDIYPPTFQGKSQDENFYRFTGGPSQNTSYQRMIDKESLAANPAESEKFPRPRRHHLERDRIRPKTRIPYGQTSIADKNDLEERNRVLYKHIKPPVILVDIDDYNRTPENQKDPKNEWMEPKIRPTDSRTRSDQGITTKKNQNYNEKDELLQNEFTFDSGKDSFPKSNDSCKDRLYTWLKSSWAKAEECQKKYREINKEKSATRRSKIKTGLLKMLRSLVKAHISKTYL